MFDDCGPKTSQFCPVDLPALKIFLKVSWRLLKSYNPKNDGQIKRFWSTKKIFGRQIKILIDKIFCKKKHNFQEGQCPRKFARIWFFLHELKCLRSKKSAKTGNFSRKCNLHKGKKALRSPLLTEIFQFKIWWKRNLIFTRELTTVSAKGDNSKFAEIELSMPHC
jgi:hypothetical protein